MKSRLIAAWRRARPFAALLAAAVALTAPITALQMLPAGADSSSTHRTSPVVGTWLGDVHGAQYEPHLLQFHADGTMISSNPSNVQERADGTGVNDSTGQGVWHMERGRVVGTFVELNASQATHQPVDTLTVRFTIEVHGDHLTGSAKVFVGAQQVPDATFDFRRVV